MKKKGKNRARVTILQGSPLRKGNTAILASAIARGAVAAGAKVTALHVGAMKIRPCTGCQGCQQRGARGCVIRGDDMPAVYDALRTADAIVFASPIYWFTMTAQLKLAVDRLYAFITAKGHRLQGKRIGLAFTYGGDDLLDSGCINAIRTFQDMFAFIRSPIVGLVHGQAGAPGSIRANRALLKRARDLGRQLVRKED